MTTDTRQEDEQGTTTSPPTATTHGTKAGATMSDRKTDTTMTDAEATKALTALEIDLLRKDVAFWIEQSDIWKRLANDERDATDRLRTVIENAPHGANCNCSTYRVEGIVQTVGCTCWKADAL